MRTDGRTTRCLTLGDKPTTPLSETDLCSDHLPLKTRVLSLRLLELTHNDHETRDYV